MLAESDQKKFNQHFHEISNSDYHFIDIDKIVPSLIYLEFIILIEKCIGLQWCQ